MTRAVLAALAALLVTAGAVSAADPGLLGGTLEATRQDVTITSTSTSPVHAVLTAERVTLTPTVFDLAPGQSAVATITGTPTGHVTALLSGATVNVQGDATTVSLTISLDPPGHVPAAPGFPWPGLILGLTLVLGLLAVLRRVKPWQYRLTRT